MDPTILDRKYQKSDNKLSFNMKVRRKRKGEKEHKETRIKHKLWKRADKG